MILENFIDIKVNNRQVKYYKDLGYNVKGGDTINIPVKDLNSNSHIKISAKCDVCGSIKKLPYRRYVLSFSTYNYYTCNKCSNNKTKRTVRDKYGVENIFQEQKTKEKIRKIFEERSEPEQNKIKDKRKETNLKKHGVENTLQLNKVKERIISEEEKTIKLYKIQKTIRSKYGVDHIMQLEHIKNKSLQNRVEFFINRSLESFKDNGIISIDFENKIYTLKCDKGHDHNYEISPKLLNNRKCNHTTLCTVCNPLMSMKGSENDFNNYISSVYDGKIIRNSRKIISPYELDIYLPELKTSFEYNGLFWHSEIHKDRNYHKKKFNLCKDKNIKLYFIWDDDWKNNRNLIEQNVVKILNGKIEPTYEQKIFYVKKGFKTIEEFPAYEFRIFF